MVWDRKQSRDSGHFWLYLKGHFRLPRVLEENCLPRVLDEPQPSVRCVYFWSQQKDLKEMRRILISRQTKEL